MHDQKVNHSWPLCNTLQLSECQLIYYRIAQTHILSINRIQICVYFSKFATSYLYQYTFARPLLPKSERASRCLIAFCGESCLKAYDLYFPNDRSEVELLYCDQ